MLRNQKISKQLLKQLLPLTQQQCMIQQQNTVLYNKSANLSRQGKMMGKLFGHRVSGSKKHWFPSTTESTQPVNPNIMFKQAQFSKSPNTGGKNAIRRRTVLNKLFMKHITDLMATGEISDTIIGKGLQVSQVKISQDFSYVSVFWLSNGEVAKDALLEQELQRCSGMLRHELSQLGLMGVVPRIQFVKDKVFVNMNQLEALLRDMDFGTEENGQQQNIDFRSKHTSETLKQEFYGRKTNDIPNLKTLEANVPEMRHDVLGLDHKGMMLKILTKMRKSKHAWEQHFQNKSTITAENFSTIPSTSFSQLTRTNEKLVKIEANSEQFEAFLAKRKEKRNTPERKKFRASDHTIDEVVEQQDYTEQTMSIRQRQLLEADDYFVDEMEDDRKHK